tara:strand:- start:1612 stop:2592 length:981 start_codon:yes stop_codon:yes gene_type:complete
MKRNIFLSTVFLLLSVPFYGQAPEVFSYQAIVYNNNNTVVSNAITPIQISVLQNGIAGTAVYVEQHTPITNANGLLSINIGGGTAITGTMSSIDWAVGTYFIKTEIDIDNNNSYDVTGASQLLSVPYTLHAKTSGSSVAGAKGDSGGDGTTVLNGTSDPVNQGNEGDFYVNTVTKTLFGPKLVAGWGTGVSLKGDASSFNFVSKRNCNSWIIPLIFYADFVSQSIYLVRTPSTWTGDSSLDTGDVFVEAIDLSGTLYNLGKITTSGKQVNELSALIKTKLEADGIVSGTSNPVSLRITVENPENVYIYANYTSQTTPRFIEVECVK